MEHQFYNALNILHKGDYTQLKRAWEKYHSWERAWRAVKSAAADNPEQEWALLEKQGIELRLASDDNFPALLKEMPWPPFGLYIKGKLEDGQTRVAIVGTRKCTPVGKLLAQQFGKDLAQKGIVVVSGLAFGIDAAAHQGTLDGGGATIGVLAGGLDYVYPRQHIRLAEQILANGGTLVSEYAKGAPGYPCRFIERNRIVSALSVGTIVIEAPARSGSLATARFAMEQNRTVLVAPGPAVSSHYSGSHALIRDGAALVTNVQQVLEELGMGGAEAERQTNFSFLDDRQKAIVAVLKQIAEPASVDRLSALSKLNVVELNQQLTLLLLQGVVQEQGGNYFV